MSGSLTGAPKVTLTEVDVSAGATAVGGAYVAMALPAPRGPVGQGVLVTDEASLVRQFTPNNTIAPSYDSGFFVALQTLKRTNKLWVSRAANTPLFGGAFVRVAGAIGAGATDLGAPAERGFANVNHYDITSTDGRINPGPIVFTADSTPGYLTIPSGAYGSLATGDVVQLTPGSSSTLPAPFLAATNYYVIKSAITNKIQLASSSIAAAAGTPITITSAGTGTFTLACTAKSLTGQAFTPDVATDAITVTSANYDLLVTGDKCQALAVGAGVLPTGLTAATDYYIIKTGVTNKLKLATSLVNAQNGVAIDLTDTGSGTLELTFSTITATTAGQDKAVLFYGADPGSYNNNLSFSLVNYATNPTKVKEPGAFLLTLYYNGVAITGESWICSFDPAHKDGRNQSIFVVDVLKQSAYVRAEVNPLLSTSATSVADTLTPIAFAGGSDGLAVTDGDMIAALNVFNTPGRYPITFIHDSGWNTPAYAAACFQLAETLGSAAAFIGAPYSTEVTTNALLDVIAYARGLGSATTHGGIFTPHVKVIDTYNNRELWISPVGDVAADYASAYDKLAPGQPVGGQFGPMNVVDTVRHWSDGELDALYDANVNPIRFKLGRGIEIWGQKTMQARPSDLDRLNARMLLMVIEPALRNAYEDFLFTRNGVSNDEGTRRDLTLLTDGFMQTIKARGGIYDWLTVCNSTNNSLVDVQNETVNIWLLVKIVKAVEYIPFTVAVTPTSIDLSLASTLI